MIKISHTQNITVRKLIEKEKSDGMPFSSDAGFFLFSKRNNIFAHPDLKMRPSNEHWVPIVTSSSGGRSSTCLIWSTLPLLISVNPISKSSKIVVI